MKSPVWLLAAAFLAGCGGANSPQVVIDPTSSEMRVNTRVRSVMLYDVSLPAYAEAVDIYTRAEDGTLVAQEGQVWADNPARAMSGALVRNLATITGAEVAADPWPLEGYPDAEVTVRVEQMFARADGAISLTGYYAIRREVGRSQIEQFDIARPGYVGAASDLPAAYDRAWTELAEQIAQDL